MGFGGYHMHVRSGMDTPYLSPEFMSLVHACVDKAESEHMLAWLYDEDRWPSGFAGGRLIFMGSAPKYLDAVPSDEPRRLYDLSLIHI